MRRKMMTVLLTGLLTVALAAPAAAARPLDLPRGPAAPAPGDATIAELAGGTLLEQALVYADLVDPFVGPGQLTVFAPSDEAFVGLATAVLGPDLPADPQQIFADIDAALGEGTVAAVLLYHVVEGRRGAISVVPPRGTRNLQTLLGASFGVNDDGTITDGAGQTVTITGINISASNGIIHTIDTVLLPFAP
jgi:uncharacterized surface protein with fasciclin (FAS1) repeats